MEQQRKYKVNKVDTHLSIVDKLRLIYGADGSKTCFTNIKYHYHQKHQESFESHLLDRNCSWKQKFLIKTGVV